MNYQKTEIMKLKILTVIGLLVLLLIQQSAMAQYKERFRTTRPFLDELEDYFNMSSNRKECMNILEQFRTFWNTKLTDDQQQRIFNTSSALLEKRARPYPHFHDYFQILMMLVEGEQGMPAYIDWEKSLLYMNNKYRIANTYKFIEFSNDFFNNNIMYSSRSTMWRAATPNYRFFFDEETETVQIEYGETDIICYAKGSHVFLDSTDRKRIFRKDSIIIENTRGSYFPFQERWIGKGGKVTWERSEFSPDEVFVNLNNYEINMKRSQYRADSVLFTHTQYLDKQLLGHFEDQVTITRPADEVTYPRFRSYSNDVFIPNVVEDISYRGGFTLYGTQFIGTGTERNKASLLIRNFGKPFIKVHALSFAFNTDRITSTRSGITIYLKEDSIYHPSIKFKYLNKDREVILYRDIKGEIRRPYTNTYHDLNMDVELVRWKMGTDEMVFTMLPGPAGVDYKANAVFESQDYFAKELDNRLHYTDEINPLIAIMHYIQYRETGSPENMWDIDTTNNEFKDYYYLNTTFSDTAYARYIRRSIAAVQTQLSRLANEGFVDYNIKIGEARILQRFDDHVRARAGKKDYDLISIPSFTKPGTKNASINLETYDLELFGIDSFRVSDPQNVTVHCDSARSMKVKQNRDFVYSGKITAGYVDFYGRNFRFNYADYKVNLAEVDSIKMRVPTSDKYGNYIDTTIHSKLEPMENFFTGVLVLDSMDNKSGLKKEDPAYSHFPYFICNDKSRVYYDENPLNDSLVYPRETFFFEVNPFRLEKLDNLEASLRLEGRFESGGILPVFNDTLQVMPDFSFGFIRDMGEKGTPLYGGKGILKNRVTLDLTSGLKATGAVEYLTSLTISDKFTFYPDSMKTHANSFTVKKKTSGVHYPAAEADTAHICWYPYQDEFIATKLDKPLKIFEEKAEITRGNLTLTPSGANAKGVIELFNGRLESNQFELKSATFNADSAALTINKPKSDKAILNTQRYVDTTSTEQLARNSQMARFEAMRDSMYQVVNNQYPLETDSVYIAMNDREKDRIERRKQRDLEDVDKEIEKMKEDWREEQQEKREQLEKEQEREKRRLEKEQKRQEKLAEKEAEENEETETNDDVAVNDSIPTDSISAAVDTLDLDVTNYMEEANPDNPHNHTVTDASARNNGTKEATDDNRTFNHVKAHIDFNKNLGSFQRNGEDVYIEFPENLYISYVDKFDWDFNGKRINTIPTSGVEPSYTRIDSSDADYGTRFISTHKGQDSLQFTAYKSVFALGSQTITAENVKEIEVADALIYPSKPIIIHHKAKMDPLIDATIIADRTNKYYTLHNANLTIMGRKMYEGSAIYDYINSVGDQYDIEFNKIKVDTTNSKLLTYGEGVITPSANFKLTPRFEYYGDVMLFANEPDLHFIGHAAINHTCKLDTNWFKFNGKINADSMYLPVTSGRLNRSRKLFTAIFVKNTVPQIYPTFLSRRHSHSDSMMISAVDSDDRSLVHYDTISNKYKMSNIYKLQDSRYPGNLISLNTESCETYAEGKLDLCVDLGQITMHNEGNITVGEMGNEAELDIVSGIDFMIAGKALGIMAQNIMDLTDSAVDITRETYYKALTNMLDTLGSTEKTDALLNEVSLSGEFPELPDIMKHTITLTDLKLVAKWDTDSKAMMYYSTGQIGVGSILDIQINRYVNGHFQLTKDVRRGNVLNLYFELDGRNWFFFNYSQTDKLMQCISSNEDFNDVISGVNEKDRIMEVAEFEDTYEYQLSSISVKNMFLRQINELKND